MNQLFTKQSKVFSKEWHANIETGKCSFSDVLIRFQIKSVFMKDHVFTDEGIDEEFQ